jgi:hypothetical protein
MNKDQIILESIYMEMAYGLSGTGEAITKKELVEHILALDKMKRGVMNVSFTAVTIPQFRKTGFPYKNLYKIKQVQGQIGYDYGSSVNKQREREGNEEIFIPQPSKSVRDYLSPSIGITFRGNYVIRYKPKLISNPSYFFAETRDGEIKEVDKEEVRPFIPEYKPSGIQGVEKTVSHLDYGIDGIVGIKIEGKDHIIEDADPIKKHIFELAQDRMKS